MRIVMDVVGMGRQLRKDNDAKVRQPLRRLDVVSRDSGLLNQVDELKEIIEEELNVRNVVFGDDESGFATLTAKANFKALGPKFGKQMKAVAGAIAQLDNDALKALAAGGVAEIVLDGETVELTGADVLVSHDPKEGLAVQTQGALVVALDLELDDDLIREGLARELVKEVQNLRKTSGLEVTDRINLIVSSDDAINEAVAAFEDYIKNEVLAVSIETAEASLSTSSGQAGESVDLNGHAATLSLAKA
jgi:isoleucyl-tRNA synthetase